MNDLRLGKKFWQERTGFDYRPIRINRPIDSDANAAYANFLTQTITPMVGKEIETEGPKTPPKRASYSRVVYGNLGGNISKTSGSSATSSTVASTITSGSSSNKNQGTNMVEVQK